MASSLDAKELYWECDLSGLRFETTADLPELDAVIGQERVVQAIRFAADMDYPGYNVYALGPRGLGKHSVAQRFLGERARQRPAPDDWCYVENFDDPHRPMCLTLPAGRGVALQHDMAAFVEDCRLGLTGAFESDEYRTRRQVIEEEMKERNEKALAEIEKDAREHGIALIHTPMGFGLAPMKGGEIVKPEVFQTFHQDEREAVEREMERIQGRLRETLMQAPRWFKETRDRIRSLNDETARFAVIHLVEALKRKYEGLPEVVAFVDAVGRDVIGHADAFLQIGAQEGVAAQLPEDGLPLFRRYRVNVLVDNGAAEHAPIVYEDNPTYDRLLGTVEHRAEMGALTTDFTLIRAGALHRANGGYLILDARKVLTNPLAWDGLKQALRGRQIRIEPMARALGLLSTQALEPAPIPLDVKIVLVGERSIYYLLCAYDPEFPDLFKVAADFDERIDRTPEMLESYVRLVGDVVRREGLRAFDRGAVARVLELSARAADDKERLSADIARLADLLREANHHARKAEREVVGAGDVDAAMRAQIHRQDRIRERLDEEIVRGTILIDTEGAKVGQVNGLAVMALGGFSFGKPSRITARVSIGRGDVVDIERQVELGGPLHSKGVLILAGYLASRYAADRPLSLDATLVFEQTYGGVDGDSASSAELYALLSAIADIPLRQSFAVTGSVNQAGEVQAIGGVNEKVEGFFDICAARGLTGNQGVLIPASNVKHLMLDRRVREAVAAGRFHVHSVETIDQGIAILTGMAAGEEQIDGRFPIGTVNRRIADRLQRYVDRRQSFARERRGEEKGGRP